jgi:DUF438 domain-containing protein
MKYLFLLTHELCCKKRKITKQYIINGYEITKEINQVHMIAILKNKNKNARILIGVLNCIIVWRSTENKIESDHKTTNNMELHKKNCVLTIC